MMSVTGEGEPDLSAGRGVADRIVDQDTQDLPDPFRITETGEKEPYRGAGWKAGWIFPGPEVHRLRRRPGEACLFLSPFSGCPQLC